MNSEIVFKDFSKALSPIAGTRESVRGKPASEGPVGEFPGAGSDRVRAGQGGAD